MVYVITGGPGFGKTILIEKLKEFGYTVGGEIARQIIENQIAEGGDLLPWKDRAGFEKRVMKERIDFLNSVDADEIAFSDRGLPDQAAFSLYKGKVISPMLKAALETNRYATKVFVTPPWRQIYKNDQIRTESFEEAVEIHNFIVKSYMNYGYELIDLPLDSSEERVAFIQKTI